MIKGFRDFILRGNVIDLAVAVVIGAAFTALITAINASLITPVVNTIFYYLGVGKDSIGGTIDLAGGPVNIGAMVGAAITFLITAAVVYFIFVAPMNHAKHAMAKKRGESAEDEGATEVDVLKEIRDLLSDGAGPPVHAATNPDESTGP